MALSSRLLVEEDVVVGLDLLIAPLVTNYR